MALRIKQKKSLGSLITGKQIEYVYPDFFESFKKLIFKTSNLFYVGISNRQIKCYTSGLILNTRIL